MAGESLATKEMSNALYVRHFFLTAPFDVGKQIILARNSL
jgi:hypothetical protein